MMPAAPAYGPGQDGRPVPPPGPVPPHSMNPQVPGAHVPGPQVPGVQGPMPPRMQAPPAYGHGHIRATGPVPPRMPAPMPPPLPGFPPPRPQRTPAELAAGRAKMAKGWAIATAVLFALGAFGTWLAYQGPSVIGGFWFIVSPLSTLMFAVGVVTGGVLGAYVIATLRALRDRALAWRPPLARSRKQIGSMHLLPGRNITGPVVILAETGITGWGKWAWFATCALWPLALVWVFAGTGGIGTFQTGVLATLAAIATAVAAASVTTALAPPDPRRLIPGGAGAGRDADDVPFWSRGLIDADGDRGPVTVTPPIDDGITELFVTADDAGDDDRAGSGESGDGEPGTSGSIGYTAPGHGKPAGGANPAGGDTGTTRS